MSDYLSPSEQARLTCTCGHRLARHNEVGCIDCGGPGLRIEYDARMQDALDALQTATLWVNGSWPAPSEQAAESWRHKARSGIVALRAALASEVPTMTYVDCGLPAFGFPCHLRKGHVGHHRPDAGEVRVEDALMGVDALDEDDLEPMGAVMRLVSVAVVEAVTQGRWSPKPIAEAILALQASSFAAGRAALASEDRSAPQYTEDDPDWSAMVSPISETDGGHHDDR